MSHTLLAIKSLNKGLNKLVVNFDKIEEDLENNWAVVAEGIQTILRREKYNEPYEVLKKLTRGKDVINQEKITKFIDELEVSDEIKDELKSITPHNYIGI